MLLAVASAAGGCQFRPLHDPVNTTYVRIYIDEHILNVTEGFYDEYIQSQSGVEEPQRFRHPEYVRPEIVRIGLFDPDNGKLVAERYLRNQGDDRRGHYYDGYIAAAPGKYNLVAYNFGTESTIIGSENDCFAMKAYTNEISPSIKSRLKSRTDNGDDDSKDSPFTKAEESIRYDADHLFVANGEGVFIPRHSGPDTLKNSAGEPYFLARSLVKSYYVQIQVTGARYISSSASLLTGMAEGARPLDRNFEDSPEATVYFEMNNGRYPDGTYPGADDYSCIYATFGTFGKLPDADSKMLVSFEFVTTYGTQISETFDLNEEFRKEDAILRQWIIIDKVINIPDPPEGGDTESGGMTPSVDDWEDVKSEVEI